MQIATIARQANSTQALFRPMPARAPALAWMPGPDQGRIEPLDYRGGVVTRHLWRRWAGVTARLTDVQVEGALTVSLDAKGPRLSAVLEETGGRVEIVTRGGRGGSGPDARHPISVVAGGHDVVARATTVRQLRHLVLDFDMATVATLFDEPVDLDAAFVTRPVITDATLQSLCGLIAGECEKGQSGGRLFGESLLLSLLLRLSQLDPAGPQPLPCGGLAPWQVRRVVEHMDVHYAADIPLGRLAALVRLSSTHFSRAFKRTTGMSPHQWLVDVRCSKAKSLLIQNRMPLAEIATATGFSDQAHFTRVFGRANGAPPAAWRRAQVS